MKGFLEGPGRAGVTEIPVSVASTVARKSLGVKVDVSYKKGVHKRRDKYWDDDEGRWKARDQMQWYLIKVGGALQDCFTPLEMACH